MASNVRVERKVAQTAHLPAAAQRQAGAESPRVSQADVARVAYELFERRGCVPGHDVEDWLEAERGVSARRRGGAR